MILCTCSREQVHNGDILRITEIITCICVHDESQELLKGRLNTFEWERHSVKILRPFFSDTFL